MKRILFSLLIPFLTAAAVSAQTATACKGRNGNDTRFTSENGIETIEKGKFKCDELQEGQITYRDTTGKILYVLTIRNRMYKGELDNKTKKIKKYSTDKDNKKMHEDGTFSEGILFTGKKYLYDKSGKLFKILILEKGIILGEVPFQD